MSLFTPTIDNTVHNSQRHTEFRVYVYRLFLGAVPLKMPKGSYVNTEHILNLDFAEANYNSIADSLQDASADEVRLFLQSFNQALSDRLKLEEPKKLFSGRSNVFNQIDITPLVTNISTNLSLYDANSAQITILDPSLNGFNVDEMARYRNNYGQISSDSSKAKEQIADEVEMLQNFSFREFDLVRIFVSNNLEKSVPDSIGNLKDLSVQESFAWVPMFTGLVNQVSFQTAADSNPTSVASCMGMYKVFTQSVTTMSLAIRDQVFVEEQSLKKDQESVNVNQSRFTQSTPDQIFEQLMQDYLSPVSVKESIQDSEESSKTKDPEKTTTIGIPSLSRFDIDNLKNTVLLSKDKGDTTRHDGGTASGTSTYNPTLVPFLPTLVIYHLLKVMTREPIFVFDDRLDFEDSHMFGRNGYEQNRVSRIRLTSAMDPYLDMVRTNFALWDSSYSSPHSIFETIRGTVYFEIFEDRMGTFHYRFPRYNQATIRAICYPSETISVSYEKTDSAVYNAVVSKQMLNYTGVIPAVRGLVYMDRISILRYGLRQPHIVENPNAKTDEFRRSLSEFQRDFSAGQTARTATVVRLGDPLINVGEMAWFKVSAPRFVIEGQPAPPPNKCYAGYINSISENISADGNYTQTLKLSFVRPCDDIVANKANPSGDVYASLSGMYSQRTLPELAYLSSSRRDVQLDIATRNLSRKQLAVVSSTDRSGRVLRPSDPSIDSYNNWFGRSPHRVEGRMLANFPFIYDVTTLAQKVDTRRREIAEEQKALSENERVQGLPINVARKQLRSATENLKKAKELAAVQILKEQIIKSFHEQLRKPRIPRRSGRTELETASLINFIARDTSSFSHKAQDTWSAFKNAYSSTIGKYQKTKISVKHGNETKTIPALIVPVAGETPSGRKVTLNGLDPDRVDLAAPAVTLSSVPSYSSLIMIASQRFNSVRPGAGGDNLHWQYMRFWGFDVDYDKISPSQFGKADRWYQNMAASLGDIINRGFADIRVEGSSEDAIKVALAEYQKADKAYDKAVKDAINASPNLDAFSAVSVAMAGKSQVSSSKSSGTLDDEKMKSVGVPQSNTRVNPDKNASIADQKSKEKILSRETKEGGWEVIKGIDENGFEYTQILYPKTESSR